MKVRVHRAQAHKQLRDFEESKQDYLHALSLTQDSELKSQIKLALVTLHYGKLVRVGREMNGGKRQGTGEWMGEEERDEPNVHVRESNSEGARGCEARERARDRKEREREHDQDIVVKQQE